MSTFGTIIVIALAVAATSLICGIIDSIAEDIANKRARKQEYQQTMEAMRQHMQLDGEMLHVMKAMIREANSHSAKE